MCEISKTRVRLKAEIGGIVLAAGTRLRLLDAHDAYATKRLSELLSIADPTDADVVSGNLLIADPMNGSHRLQVNADDHDATGDVAQGVRARLHL